MSTNNNPHVPLTALELITFTIKFLLCFLIFILFSWSTLFYLYLLGHILLMLMILIHDVLFQGHLHCSSNYIMKLSVFKPYVKSWTRFRSDADELTFYSLLGFKSVFLLKSHFLCSVFLTITAIIILNVLSSILLTSPRC